MAGMTLSIEYLAGVFDADGSVGIYQRGEGSYQINVSIANSGARGRELAAHLKSRYGGSIVTQARRKEIHRDCFHWKLNGKGACGTFLDAIAPHVFLKLDQVQLARSFLILAAALPRYRSDQQKQVLADYVARCKALKRM